MIQDNISSGMNQLPNTKNLYVLVGFNRWLDIVSHDLDETTQFLDLPSLDEDITIDLTALNSAFQSGKPIYFSTEAFLWLPNNALAGILKMYKSISSYLETFLYVTTYKHMYNTISN